jgi:hypothetical protein
MKRCYYKFVFQARWMPLSIGFGPEPRILEYSLIDCILRCPQESLGGFLETWISRGDEWAERLNRREISL